MTNWLRHLIAWTLCCTSAALGIPPAVQIDQIMAGANGDAAAQYVELRLQTPADNLWGPQAGESVGRLKLVFFDVTGAQVGEYVFASNAPIGTLDEVNGGYRVLVTTAAFASLPGMPAPDFTFPARIMAQSGKICLTSNAANPNAPELNLCLSYGNFVADTGSDTLGQPAGPPAIALPITDAQALQRTQNFANYGTGQYNADFALGPANPTNSAGATGSIPVASMIDQGRNLFVLEKYNGNGRTCFTCHRPDILFGLSPAKVSLLPPNDPLFIAEFDAGLGALENPCLMHGSRGVNLENIDGFSQPPVFRGSPNLINLAFSAPYGRSGEFADLRSFATGAVVQHFTKTLVRNGNPNNGPIDYRLPTPVELDDLEAFMLSIKLPADGNFNLTRMTNAAVARGADSTAIQRGRDLFFGVTGNAKCFMCHNPPVLAAAAPALGGGNQSFNTGVSNLAINATFPDACLGGQPMPPEAGGARSFSTPSLIGVARTAPYFHNNAVRTLREAVAFYSGPEFNNSPASQNPLIANISMSEGEIDDITTFLSALDEPFVDCDSDTIDDRVQIAAGASDCNHNGVLDACELAADDCDANGIPDECDLAPVRVAPAVLHATSSGGFFITSADVDGDGHADLIVPGWSDHNVVVLLNGGNGSSFTSGGAYPVTSYARAVAVADFDGDGDLDMAVPNLLANEVSLLLNNGRDAQYVWLGFAPATPIPMNAGGGQNAGSIHVLAADLNYDGYVDLAVCKNFMDQIAVVLNRGPDGMGGWLGFAAPVDYSVGSVGPLGPWAVAAGRLHAGNALDLVVANRSADSISVFVNYGDGTFAAPVSYTVQESPESVVVADLTGDGVADVAVANSDSDTLTVFTGTGTGGLAAPRTVVVGSYPFGAQPHSVVVGDIDRDGDLDLVVANKVSSNVSVLLNDGQGEFPTLTNLALPAGPDYAVLADLDADGSLDVAAVRFANAASYVLMNATAPFAGDCNHNGIPDVCEIQAGTSLDLNHNNIPDQCERLGDINLDGLINDVDLAMLVDVLLGLDVTPAHVAASDIDGSGVANGLDVQSFVRLFAAGF